MTTPQLSIGLPVYNGENYLIEALDSLLGQTFTDFELVISDNASTDSTQQICEQYAAEDTRIRFYRQAQNMGAAWNYNFVFKEASGEYFKWAAHDDLCAPRFLEVCVAALDQDPSVVLGYTKTDIMYVPNESSAGNVAGGNNDDPDVRCLVPSRYSGKYDVSYEDGIALLHYNLRMDVDSPQTHQRFHDLICVPHECFPIFGVIRSEVLQRTQLIGGFSSSDRTLLAELALYGRFEEVQEFLFTRRLHAKSSGPAYKSRRARTAWFDPEKAHKMVFPNWRILNEYAKSVARAPLDTNDRMRCYGQLVFHMQTRWKGLVMDFVKNATQTERT